MLDQPWMPGHVVSLVEAAAMVGAAEGGGLGGSH